MAPSRPTDRLRQNAPRLPLKFLLLNRGRSERPPHKCDRFSRDLVQRTSVSVSTHGPRKRFKSVTTRTASCGKSLSSTSTEWDPLGDVQSNEARAMPVVVRYVREGNPSSMR